jgi:phospholipid-binding lipoprotein MlaA
MMRRNAIRILCTAVVFFAVGATTIAGPAFAADAGDDSSEVDEFAPNDPWEGFNRGVFQINEKIDIYFLRPVAVGWDFVMPDLVQTAIKNIFMNVRFPVIFVNDLLQAKPIEAGEDLGRFIVNTSVGIGGIWDPAKRIGLVGNDEDFGQTLGYWGVPPGPYLVLPLLGPSSPRDAFGLAGDAALQSYSVFLAWYITTAITTTRVLNTRAEYLEEIDENRRTALDYYAFQRNAYVSYRENLVRDREEDTEAPTDDLYYFEEDEEEREESHADEGDGEM